MPQWFIIVCAMFFYVGICNLQSGYSFVAFYQRSTPNNHKINPKPCSVNGLPGTCMFVWQCINTEGHHIGMCVDTFMFGSCCAHNLTSSQLAQITDSSEPAILYTPQQQQQHSQQSNLQQQSSSPSSSSMHHQHSQQAAVALHHHSSSSVRPSVVNTMISNTTTSGITSSGINNNSGNKPSRQKPKPSTSLSSSSLSSVDRPAFGNQMRPNGVTSNIDRVQSGVLTDRLTTHKPSASSSTLLPTLYSAAPVPSQLFHHHHHHQQHQPHHHNGGNNNHNNNNNNNLPNHNKEQQTKPNSSSFTSQSPSKAPTFQNWPSSISVSTATPLPSISFNTRPTFILHSSTSSAVLHHVKNFSSHFTTSTATTTTTTTTESWNNQNLESNEIEDISNHIDSGNHYHQRPHYSGWQSASSSTTFAPFSPQYQSPPVAATSFITKPRPPSHPNLNKYKPWIVAGSTVHSAQAAPHIPSFVNITKLQTTKPLISTTTGSTLWPSTSTTTTSDLTNTTITSVPGTISSAASVDLNKVVNLTSSANTNGSLSASSVEKPAHCGISPLQPTRHGMRIVGGRNAQFGAWAWQVSVRRTSFFGFSSTHRCGGALLNENWIATAGHCVDDLLTSQIRIRVGEYDFSSVQEPYPFAERAVARKVVHPKYNFFTYEYDLAVVKMDSPLEYAPHIVPICLPGSDDLLIGENATVTGWGRLSEGGTLPSVLQEVSVPIVSNEKCKSMFLRAGRHEYIPEIFMCAGFDNGGRDSCQGDSGGPLQVRGKDGRFFLAGIISWGIGCAEANLPGVCTRISKFVPWILQTVIT